MAENNLEVKVRLEQALHRILVDQLKAIYVEHGIAIKRVSVEWANIEGDLVPKGMELVTYTKEES